MNEPLVLITGFGPFPQVDVNPSGRAAAALEADPPPGIRVVGRELPVELHRAGDALEAALLECRRRPDFLLSLGVQRGGWWRPEGLARARMDSTKPDNAGRFAAELPPLGDRDLESSVDPVRVAELLIEAGASDARPSRDAGGYVCERTFYANLVAAERLGVPGTFLHVPNHELVSLDEQVAILRRALPRFLTEWCW